MGNKNQHIFQNLKVSLIEYINTEYPDIFKINTQRVYYFGNKTSRLKAFISSIKKNNSEIFPDDSLRVHYLDMEENEIQDLIVDCVNEIIDKRNLDNQNRILEDYDYLENIVFLVDMESKDTDNYYVFDKNLGKIRTDITYQGLNKLGPEIVKVLKDLDRKACKFIYNPTDKQKNYNMINVGQIDFMRVNTYEHPSWREIGDEAIISSPCDGELLPPLANEFFNHLFPSKPSREYVFKWLQNAMMSKQGSEFILILNGPTGTGKTIFGTDLMQALFGKKNWGQAPKGLFKSAFNSVLKDKRILFIDEAKINQDNYETVKLYANKTLNIEAKYIDADNVTDLYYSMILSNNKMSKIYVDPDDRRFAIVETTNVKLNEIWSEKKIKEFLKKLEDKEFIGQIGTYILKRKVKPLIQFKNKRFYEFVWRHLSEWNKIICNKVFKEGKEEEREISLEKLRLSIKNQKTINFDIQLDTIVEFIQSYKHDGKHLLGTIIVANQTNEDDEEDNNEQVLKINSHFIKNYNEPEDQELL